MGNREGGRERRGEGGKEGRKGGEKVRWEERSGGGKDGWERGNATCEVVGRWA